MENSDKLIQELIEALKNENNALREKNQALEIQLAEINGKYAECSNSLNSLYDILKSKIVVNDSVKEEPKVEKQLLVEEVVETPVVEPAVEPVTQNYTRDELLDEYLIGNNLLKLDKLFELYPDETKRTLTEIRSSLPENINQLAKKHKFVKELQILKKSNRLIKELEMTDKTHHELHFTDLINRYIESFQQDRKLATTKYLQQALVYYPFQFDLFVTNISAYKNDDFDVQVEELKRKLYKNLMVTTSKPKKVAPVPTTSDSNDEKKRYSEYKKVDYANSSIEDLVALVEQQPNNKAQFIRRTIAGMIKRGRTDEECKTFETNANIIRGK
jgi:hypothetical protein